MQNNPQTQSPTESDIMTTLKNYSETQILAIEIEKQNERIKELKNLANLVDNKLTESKSEIEGDLYDLMHSILVMMTSRTQLKSEEKILKALLLYKNNHPNDESLQNRIDEVGVYIETFKGSMCENEVSILELIKEKVK